MYITNVENKITGKTYGPNNNKIRYIAGVAR